MRLFNVSFSTLIVRFYLMMAIVIAAFFLGYPWLSALSLPVFFITLIGLKFSLPVLFSGHKSSVSHKESLTIQKTSKESQHQTAH